MKKSLTLGLSTIALSLSLSLFAQQSVYQLSDGGIPWGYKFTQYDELIPMEVMPGFNQAALEQEDLIRDQDKSIPYRFGYVFNVSYNLNNSGAWYDLPDGGRIWRLGIKSPGAYSLNLVFQYVSIPEGCTFFVYNQSRTIHLGSFSQRFISPEYTFSTDLIDGDAVIVELYEPADKVGQSSLEVSHVTHRYRDIRQFVERSFGQSGSCMNNVRCPAYTAYDDQIRSVVCLVSPTTGEFCTGALINNTCNDGTPYVLTANHCGNSGFSTWIFRFNWESSGCTNPGSSPSSQSISGGTQRAANAGSDMSLVQINSAIPSNYNVYFAGWDRQNNTTNNAYGIHHPSGDIKKISFTTGATSTATYSGATCWRTGTWTDGVTEPGSSGSPLFNSSGQIIGQLYGGPSNCGYEGNPTNGVDYYGKLFTSWTGGGSNSTRLSNWLDPASCNTGATTLNGYDPNAPSLAFDAQIQSITSPASSECDGNITPVVVLKNNGTNTLTSVTINWSVDGGPATAYAWSGNLTTGSTVNVTLPNISVGAGAHTYTATTSNPNGSTDQNSGNDGTTVNFTVVNATGVSLPFSEGFESTTFAPANWTNENPNGNSGNALWVRTTTCSGFGNSTACAKIDQFSPSASTTGQLDNLITPYLNLTTASTPINLTFSVANVRYGANNYDSLIVWITTDCGGSWTRLQSYGNNTGPNPLATANDNTNAFTPTAGQWATKTISLNAYASQTSVRIRFQLKSGWGNNTYIDDVNISGPVSGLPNPGFTMSNNTICAGTTINFTNTSTNAMSYNWSFPGGSPTSSTQTNPSVTFNSAGTYTVTLTATNTSGSSTSTQTVNVVANPVPSITQAGANLSTGSFNTYQWYLNGSPIAGATSQNYTATQNGNYTVQVTNSSGCTGTSSAVTVSGLSLDENNPANQILIYPNPAHHQVTINNPHAEGCTVQVMNLLGASLTTYTIQGSGVETLDISGLASGTYLVKLSVGQHEIVRRIIVIQ